LYRKLFTARTKCSHLVNTRAAKNKLRTLKRRFLKILEITHLNANRTAPKEFKITTRHYIGENYLKAYATSEKINSLYIERQSKLYLPISLFGKSSRLKIVNFDARGPTANNYDTNCKPWRTLSK